MDINKLTRKTRSSINKAIDSIASRTNQAKSNLNNFSNVTSEKISNSFKQFNPKGFVSDAADNALDSAKKAFVDYPQEVSDWLGLSDPVLKTNNPLLKPLDMGLRNVRGAFRLADVPSYAAGGYLEGYKKKEGNSFQKNIEGFKNAFESIGKKENLLMEQAPEMVGVDPNSMTGLVLGLTAEVLMPDPFDVVRLKKVADKATTLSQFKKTIPNMKEARLAARKAGYQTIDDFWMDNNKGFIKLENLLSESPARTKNRRVVDMFDQQKIDEATLQAAVNEDDIPTLKRVLNNTFNPLKNAPENVQRIVKRWQSEITKGNVSASKLANKFSHIPEVDGWKMVRYIEDPTPKNAKILNLNVEKYSDDLDSIRKTYDKLRKEGIAKGLDIGYLDNYLNHIWEETPEQIDRIVRGLSKKPSFTKSRSLPSLNEGIELGLKPRYTHPSQYVAHYKYSLDKALANEKLADELLDGGVLLPTSKAPRSWKSITAQLFPKVEHTYDGKKVVEYYSAPDPIARSLNNIFEQDTGGLVSFAANLSRYMQDITLSGGYKTLNAFSFGNAIKEVTAGRVRSPMSAFVISFSDKKTRKYFIKNSKYLELMADEGISVRTNIDYKELFENLAEKSTLSKKLQNVYDEIINEPTFKRFLPMLQVNLFRETYESAVDEIGEHGARKLAGNVIRNFYGIADTLSRPRLTDDTLTAAFFAPKFRQTMITFWKNNIDALNPRKLSNKSYKFNRRFLVGTGLTYVLYNTLNRTLSGHPMNENKPGKEFFLEIPVSNERSWFIPMLPSVGTVPRRALEIGSNIIHGDLRAASNKFGSFFSQPVNLFTQLATDTTFYGGRITDKNDNLAGKAKDLAGYTVEQTSHPLIGEPISVAQGRKTIPEGILGLLELPIYASSGSDYKKSGLGNIEGKIEELEELPFENEFQKAIKIEEAFKLVNNIIESDTDDEIKISYLNKIGVNPKDASYYYLANEKVSAKTAFIVDYLANNHEASLIPFRKEINGKKILTSSVINELVDKGIISKSAGKALKNTEYKDGLASVPRSAISSGRKKKTLKYNVTPLKRIKAKVPDLSELPLNMETTSFDIIRQTKDKTFINIAKLRRELGLDA